MNDKGAVLVFSTSETRDVKTNVEIEQRKQ